LNLIYFNNYQQSTSPILYTEYSKYPKITKDISCFLPKTINFYKLKHFLEKNCNYLKNILFFDIYFDKNNPNFVNIGLRFEFQSEITTLTNEMIEIEIEKSKNFLISHFNSKVR
jgi:phenylalanyl-tRNA synthetase beta subunit